MSTHIFDWVVLGVVLLMVVCRASPFGKARIIKEQIKDQCPDSFDHPFDYETILGYSVIGQPSSRTAPCVVITQLSVDRIHHLERLVRAWKGVVSAAIYVPAVNRHAYLTKVQEFSRTLQDKQHPSSYTILSVLFGHEDAPWRYKCSADGAAGFPLYPVNNLRNAAVAASGGPKGHSYPLFFLLDADFIPSAGLRPWVDAQAESGLIKRCDKGDMIVVPAFESKDPVTSNSQKFLVSGWHRGSITQFHVDRFNAGHGSSDYARWVALTEKHMRDGGPLVPYAVKWEPGYEPYVIVSRKIFVPYDERFRGYFMNKIVQLEGMAVRSKGTYHVLPGHFVVEEAHASGANHKALNQKSIVDQIFELFRLCQAEFKSGDMPHISNATKSLFAASGIPFA